MVGGYIDQLVAWKFTVNIQNENHTYASDSLVVSKIHYICTILSPFFTGKLPLPTFSQGSEAPPMGS